MLLSFPGLKALYPSTPQDAFNAILAAYDKIEALDESLIPADSLIREFIGGGSFSY